MNNTTEKRTSIGKYGVLRRQYLQQYRPEIFCRYKEQGVLAMHLELVEEETRRLVNGYICANMSANGITAALRRTDPLEWVRRMNRLKAEAEEIFLFQTVWAEETQQPEEDPPF